MQEKMADSKSRLYEPRNYPCIVCSKRTTPKERRDLSGPRNKEIRKFMLRTFLINVKETDVTCVKCRSKYYRHRGASFHETAQPNDDNIDLIYNPPEKKHKADVDSPKNITLPLSSVMGSSHSSCCICKRRGPKFIVVPASVRYHTFIDRNIIITAGARCCPGHIEDDRFKDGAFERISDLRSETCLNRTDIVKLIESIRNIALENKSRRIDFDLSTSMTDADYYNLLGIDKASFEDICSHVQSLRDSKIRSYRTCIGILLTKLRSGMSNKLLSTVFNISVHSVKRAITSARKALAKDFTPKYVGFEHIDRVSVISQHTRSLAQAVFGGNNIPAILVIDGTYIYIQKSSQFNFQRRSFSLHKRRPLVKPMMVVSTTGYVVSVIGPYLSDGKNNDASILKHAISSNIEKMREWLQEDDVFIVDRGFRDSVDLLEDLGIRTEMPAFLQKGRKQHTVEESNATRLVTKIRWVVESVNGRVKTWKFLDNVVPNSQIPYIGEYVRLVCAISNKYRQALSASHVTDEQLGSKMLHLSKQSNELMQKVEREGLDKKRNPWENIDASDTIIPDFPRLDEEDLRNITFGVYQLKLAKSYTREHLSEDGGYDLLVHKDQNGLLMAKIQSRHVSSRVYKLWLDYDQYSVRGWYCQCRAGARVVGTCAHIAAIIWYLGYARHQNAPFNSMSDWSSYLNDAQDLPEPLLIDDDDDDDNNGGNDDDTADIEE